MRGSLLDLSLAGYLGCLSLALTTTVASAEGDHGFGDSSLKGTYAGLSIARGGLAPVASAALIVADGKGGFTGKAIVNRPDQKHGGRIIVEVPLEGGYWLEKDGIGTLERFGAGDLGASPSAHLMVTETRSPRHREPVVNEFAIIPDELLANTLALPSAVLKRRPGHAMYDNASVKGTYGSVGIGRGGMDPVAGMTMLTADGKGNLTGKTIFNRPDPKTGDRMVLTIPVEGTYEVEADGMGTLEILLPPEVGTTQTGHFLVTHSRGPYRRPLATEIVFILDDLLPNSGALQTSELKLISE